MTTQNELRDRIEYVLETRDRDESESMVRWNTGMYRVERVVGEWEPRE